MFRMRCRTEDSQHYSLAQPAGYCHDSTPCPKAVFQHRSSLNWAGNMSDFRILAECSTTLTRHSTIRNSWYSFKPLRFLAVVSCIILCGDYNGCWNVNLEDLIVKLLWKFDFLRKKLKFVCQTKQKEMNSESWESITLKLCEVNCNMQIPCAYSCHHHQGLGIKRMCNLTCCRKDTVVSIYWWCLGWNIKSIHWVVALELIENCEHTICFLAFVSQENRWYTYCIPAIECCIGFERITWNLSGTVAQR